MEVQEMKDLKLTKPPAGWNPLDAQRELQKLIKAHKPEAVTQHEPAATMRELLERVRFNNEAIIVELVELLDMTESWKAWKAPKYPLDGPVPEDVRIEMAFEVIDAWHFLNNLALALGLSWTEMLSIYATKVEENTRRQMDGY